MQSSSVERNFLFYALLTTAVLVYFIFQPFLYAVVAAAVFATVLLPIYHWLLARVHSGGLASIITILLLVVFVFVPLILLGQQVLQEASGLYDKLTNGTSVELATATFRGLESWLGGYFSQAQNLELDLGQYLRTGLSWLVGHLGGFFAGVARTLGSLVIFLIALYYLLRDGEKLRAVFLRVSPLKDSDDERILHKLEIAVSSVVKGNLLVALIQGILTSIGLMIFGVPNAILWGSLAAICALIPGVGTMIVLVPAIIYSYFASGFLIAAGLLIWGVLAVGLIDNFLGPKLVSRGTALHPLVVLLSVLGGLAFFGPIGFLFGPLVMTLLFALLEIYFGSKGY